MTASKLDTGHLFCLGYGYTAQFLAGYLISKNWRVSASTRSGDVSKTVEGVLLKPFETLNGEDFDSVTHILISICLLYTSPSPRDGLLSRMPSSA